MKENLGTTRAWKKSTLYHLNEWRQKCKGSNHNVDNGNAVYTFVKFQKCQGGIAVNTVKYSNKLLL